MIHLPLDACWLGIAGVVLLWSRPVISGQVRRSRHAGALLFATLLAVVLAVFVMHTLTSHRTHCTTSASALSGVESAVAHQHPDGGHHDEAGSAKSSSPESPDQDHGAPGVICWAMLMLAAFVALALSRGVPSRVLFVMRRWTSSGLLPRGRSADPPCLHRLSVLRC